MADDRVATAHIGDLRQGDEELMGPLDKPLLIAGGEPGQPQGVFLHGNGRQAPLFRGHGEHHPQGRDEGEEDKQP
jgi:hypothetical protein